MSGKTKLFFTEQAKLSELNLGQLQALLAEGESTIYVDSNDILRIAEKNDGVVSQKNAVGDQINSLDVGEVPSGFPSADTGYALMAVRDGSQYKLIWGWVDTTGNYNVVDGNTIFTVVSVNPTFQIYNSTGVYPFNGNIFINVSGDGAYVAKKYSFDNGVTFSELNSSPYYALEQIGSMTGDTYNLVIKDSANTTLYTNTISLLPPDYSFVFFGSGLYTPANMSHVIYKDDDFNMSRPSELNVVVTEDDTHLPGLFKYDIYDEFNNLVFETGFIPNKIARFPITQAGTFSAQVSRIHGGYIELGEWISPTNLSVYKPNDFRWHKDGETTFSVPSFFDEPFVLQGAGDTIRINYEATEIGELGGAKNIYMRRGETTEVYQQTQYLLQSSSASTPTNMFVQIYQTPGIIADFLFGSMYGSDTYFTPISIAWADPFTFRVQFLSTNYVTNPNTELIMLVEDMEGNLITTETATLINASVITGMEYEFYITNFASLISPYLTQVIRTRFVFDPDTTDPDPNKKISSNLKFVRYD